MYCVPPCRQRQRPTAECLSFFGVQLPFVPTGGHCFHMLTASEKNSTHAQTAPPSVQPGGASRLYNRTQRTSALFAAVLAVVLLFT